MINFFSQNKFTTLSTQQQTPLWFSMLKINYLYATVNVMISGMQIRNVFNLKRQAQ